MATKKLDLKAEITRVLAEYGGLTTLELAIRISNLNNTSTLPSDLTGAISHLKAVGRVKVIGKRLNPALRKSRPARMADILSLVK